MVQVFGANIDWRARIERAKTNAMLHEGGGRYSEGARYKRALSLVSVLGVELRVGKRTYPMDHERVCRLISLLHRVRLEKEEHSVYFAMLCYIGRVRRSPSRKIVFSQHYWMAQLAIAKKYGFEQKVAEVS